MDCQRAYDMVKNIDTARLEWARLVLDSAATDAQCTAARGRLDSLLRDDESRSSRLAMPQARMKILLVDDDADTRLAFSALLTQCGWDVRTASDGEQAYALLQEDDALRLAIVDWMMPGMTGPALCRKLRESDKTNRTHIIMLTGRRGTDDMVTGLDSGADDFIAKPVNIAELDARIRAAQRLIDRQEQLRIQANVDELTGILNRAAIRDVLRRALDHAAREQSSISVVLCDVDRFKSVNDAHGHPVGDSVLSGVAKRVSAGLRPYDVLGRYGGEEFLIVLPGCSLPEALGVAERARVSVCCEGIETSGGLLPITMSFGVATATGDARNLDELISDADRALYRAKEAGRNCVEGPAR
jgi:two-component system, cell cycle response regulator